MKIIGVIVAMACVVAAHGNLLDRDEYFYGNCNTVKSDCRRFSYGSSLTTGQVYKIISATNHTVLDVKDDIAFDDNVIIPYYWKETAADNQLWVADEVSPGVYVFSSLLSRNFALDASRKIDGELIIHAKHGWKNQQWVVEPVKPNSFTFYIRSVYSNKVIELDADRQGVSLMPKDKSNRNQRWIIADRLGTK